MAKRKDRQRKRFGEMSGNQASREDLMHPPAALAAPDNGTSNSADAATRQSGSQPRSSDGLPGHLKEASPEWRAFYAALRAAHDER